LGIIGQDPSVSKSNHLHVVISFSSSLLDTRSTDRIPSTSTRYFLKLRATSHTRLRARDHYTSHTLIGGKGGAGPSSLHTMLEGPTEYANYGRWM
jgi:hypothetical protein